MSSESPRPRHPDVTLADLTAGLLWPRLFETGRLAIRPERMLFGLATVVVVGLIGSLSLIWGGDGPSFGAAAGAFISTGTGVIGSWYDGLSLARPWDLRLEMLAGGLGLIWGNAAELARLFPWSVWLLGLPMLAALLVGWAAIARSAAWEFGIGTVETGPVVLATAIRRLPALLLATLGLPLFVAVVAVGLGAAGWLLLGIPVVNVGGAVLWGGALLIGLVLVPLLAAWVIGFPLLAPAVMCEGPDAFEAAQRAMAYVFGRPLRYLIYLGTLIALGAVVGSIIMLILYGADAFATGASAMFLDPNDARPVTGVAPDGVDGAVDLEGAAAIAAGIIGFWHALLSLLLSAFIVSYAASASAVLYLLMRKLNDGQDPGDLAAEIVHG